ncbi:hypothetical protein ACFTAO_39680 [Paenibacillus rhizoplanae]
MSVVMVLKKSWQLNMASERKRAASEQLLITNSIYENLESNRFRGMSLNPELLVNVTQSYGQHYRKQGIELELRENGRLLYPIEDGGVPVRRRRVQHRRSIS